MAELKPGEQGEVDRAADLNDEKLCIRRCKKSNHGAINRVFTARAMVRRGPAGCPGCNPTGGKQEDKEPVRSAGAQKRHQKYPGIGAFRGAA